LETHSNLYLIKISKYRYHVIEADDSLAAAKFAVTEYGFRPNYEENKIEVFLLDAPPITYNIDYSLKFSRVNVVESKEYESDDPLFKGGLVD
jgi:hypothetical protein